MNSREATDVPGQSGHDMAVLGGVHAAFGCYLAWCRRQAVLELMLCSLMALFASQWGGGLDVHILMAFSVVCQALQTRAALFVLLQMKAA